MLNVFRDDGAVIRKLLLYQFVSAVVGMMLALAVLSAKWLNMLTSVVSVMFYCYFIYTGIWDAAAKDRLKVDGGRMSKDMTKGLKLALAANIPNIVLGVLAFVFCAIGSFTQLEWAGNGGVLIVGIARLWQAMYNGIIVFIVPTGLTGWGFILSNLIYLAITIPAFVISHIAYHMGFNGLRIIKVGNKSN